MGSGAGLLVRVHGEISGMGGVGAVSSVGVHGGRWRGLHVHGVARVRSLARTASPPPSLAPGLWLVCVGGVGVGVAPPGVQMGVPSVGVVVRVGVGVGVSGWQGLEGSVHHGLGEHMQGALIGFLDGHQVL